MNASAPEIARRASATASSEDDALSQAVDIMDAALLDELVAYKARNAAFDAETSGRYEPKKQRDWLIQVERELTELSEHVHTGPLPGSQGAP